MPSAAKPVGEAIITLLGGPFDGGRCITPLRIKSGRHVLKEYVEVELINDRAHKLALYKFSGIGPLLVPQYRFEGRK